MSSTTRRCFTSSLLHKRRGARRATCIASTRAHPSLELGAKAGCHWCRAVPDRPNRLRCYHDCVQWQPEQRRACAVVCTACPGESGVPRLMWRVLAYASASHVPGRATDPTRLCDCMLTRRFQQRRFATRKCRDTCRSSRRRCSTVQQPKQQQEKKQRWQRSRPEGCCADNNADDAETKAHSNRGRCSHVLSMMNSTF